MPPPYTNSTANAISTNNASSTASEVSGPTVFWALLAIALNAMGQESPTAKALFNSGNLKDGLLMPYLSSPLICLSDIFVDCYQLGTRLWRTSRKSPQRESTQSVPRSLNILNATAVRTILVIFGVIPQAIRLYGMTNIPEVQVLATIYLSVALIRLAKNTVLQPQTDADCENLGESEIEIEPHLVFRIAPLFLIGGHVAAWYWIWSRVTSTFRLDPENEHTRNAMAVAKWSSIVTGAVGFFGPLVWMANLLFDGNRRAQNFRPMWIVVAMMFTSSISSHLDALTGQTLTTILSIYPPLVSMAAAALFSWLIASMLSLLLRSVGNSTLRTTDTTSGTAEIARTGTNLANDAEQYASPGRTTSTSATSTPTSKDPFHELDLCMTCSLSVLFERNMGTVESTREMGGNWPSDPVVKCRVIAYFWRRFLVTIPKALLAMISSSRDRDIDSERIVHGVRATLSKLWSILFLSSSQNLILGISIIALYFELGPINTRLEQVFYRLSNKQLTFAVFNLISGGMWYSRVWDGTGTAVPNWESWFG